MSRAAKSSRTAAGGSAERTKARILQAAIDEFAEHGLAGGRVDRIARKAGVNKQALYYHYGDKESLFKASLAYGYSASFVRIDPVHDGRGPVELMTHIVGNFFDMVLANRNHVALIADENRSKGRHLTRDVLPEIRKATGHTMRAIEEVLRRGQREGVFSRKVDPLALYLLIVGAPIFYANHCHTLSGILRHNILSPARVARHRQDVIAVVLAALRP